MIDLWPENNRHLLEEMGGYLLPASFSFSSFSNRYQPLVPPEVYVYCPECPGDANWFTYGFEQIDLFECGLIDTDRIDSIYSLVNRSGSSMHVDIGKGLIRRYVQENDEIVGISYLSIEDLPFAIVMCLGMINPLNQNSPSSCLLFFRNTELNIHGTINGESVVIEGSNPIVFGQRFEDTNPLASPETISVYRMALYTVDS